MNNRQVASAGQAALVAMQQNEERRLASLRRSAVSQNRTADEIARNTKMAGVGRKPNTDLPPGPDTDDRAYVAMVTRAKALIPKLSDRAARTEELRRLPPETERDLHDAGLFRIVQPKRGGGAEFDYVALVDCADALGQADASVAWNFANLASHHWMLGMFDRRAQDLVWDKDANALIASSFIFPAGRARKVDGGDVLHGRLPVSSGGGSSGWKMLCSAFLFDDETDRNGDCHLFVY